MISLDCTVKSSLDWGVAAAKAREVVNKGNPLVWKLEMGLFQGLKSLTHALSFQALTLALEHFRDTLWKEFQAHTGGIVLYQGTADFSTGFPWDPVQEENYTRWLRNRGSASSLSSLYCTYACADYLGLLVQRLPDGMPLKIHLDASAIEDLYLRVLLLNPELYPRIEMVVQGAGSVSFHKNLQVKQAVCLPASNHLKEVLIKLEKERVGYKIIPENDLITEWDGLDQIYYDSTEISPQGKRKLQGFCAAGGEIIDISVNK